MKEHPKCRKLLDTEGCGSGEFQPELDQPDLCNAQSTSLFELHLLTVSYFDNIILPTFAVHGLFPQSVASLSWSHFVSVRRSKYAALRTLPISLCLSHIGC